MPKLTKRSVEEIMPDSTKPVIVWDSEMKGFIVVVLPSGRRTYCIEYRNPQRIKKRMKLGVHGSITTEEARILAKKYLASVTHGEDPATQRMIQKTLPRIKDLAHDYLERHGVRKRSRSLEEDKKLLKIILPALGGQLVKEVSRRDIESLHLKLVNTPYQANRTLALLSKMFSLAVGWGWASLNPVKGIERYQEIKRDRWLDQNEVNRLWEALDQYPTSPSAFAFKLLLLTGARKGEVLQATWDQFDLEQGVWTKPSHLTKQKKTEHLPLSSKALGVLSELKKLTSHSPYLFPSRLSGRPLREIDTLWKSVLKKAGLEKIRIHDLRHTHASHLVSSGLSLSIVGKLLGHTQASTTQRYAHLADEPLRQAAELFGQRIQTLTEKASPVLLRS